MRVTKGNRFRRKAIFELDPDCKICKESIEAYNEWYEEIREEQKKLREAGEPNTVYGSFRLPKRSLFEMKRLPYLKLVPDFNSSGILTHWHIEMCQGEEDDKNRNIRQKDQ